MRSFKLINLCYNVNMIKDETFNGTFIWDHKYLVYMGMRKLLERVISVNYILAKTLETVQLKTHFIMLIYHNSYFLSIYRIIWMLNGRMYARV